MTTAALLIVLTVGKNLMLKGENSKGDSSPGSPGTDLLSKADEPRSSGDKHKDTGHAGT